MDKLQKTHPRLENWVLHNHETWSNLSGQVFGSTKFPDNSLIFTSYLRAFSLEEEKATTRNSVYLLGKPGAEITEQPLLSDHDEL